MTNTQQKTKTVLQTRYTKYVAKLYSISNEKQNMWKCEIPVAAGKVQSHCCGSDVARHVAHDRASRSDGTESQRQQGETLKRADSTRMTGTRARCSMTRLAHCLFNVENWEAKEKNYANQQQKRIAHFTFILYGRFSVIFCTLCCHRISLLHEWISSR